MEKITFLLCASAFKVLICGSCSISIPLINFVSFCRYMLNSPCVSGNRIVLLDSRYIFKGCL
ncbi:hypothetical protein MtrunA17_Chr6g0462561 [Medicago truncatula]|uniref:Uncharacterized protein n=1 Tax=Medicago truncatula TaxID=3880 RepID=A0A396HE55_MEDTR|nr:hypothetical protein MtrunA17_Chr6g0462561 [Medicago truncatula]